VISAGQYTGIFIVDIKFVILRKFYQRSYKTGLIQTSIKCDFDCKLSTVNHQLSGYISQLIPMMPNFEGSTINPLLPNG